MKKTQKILIVILAIVLVASLLVACGKKGSGGSVPTSPDKAKSNLESNGYTVVTPSSSEMAVYAAMVGCTVADVDSMLVATSGEDYIYVVFATSANVAKEKYNTLKDTIEELMPGMKHGVSGKVVYVGTEDAYKAMCKAAAPAGSGSGNGSGGNQGGGSGGGSGNGSGGNQGGGSGNGGNQGGGSKPTHVCGHVCPTCNKCTDKTCTNPACAQKCAGHGGVSTSPYVPNLSVAVANLESY